jgi:hypothetical protein
LEILLASNDHVRVRDYRHLSAGAMRLLRAASKMPCSGLLLWQIGFSQGFGQIAANTNFFVVRHKSRDRLTVLQKHKRNVLIVRAVNAVRKIARSFRDGHARFLHQSDCLLFLVFFRLIKSWTLNAADVAGYPLSTLILTVPHFISEPGRPRMDKFRQCLNTDMKPVLG